ncbi:MAG: heme ABC exporter ATP-binding protein CcmA [Parvibaculaceae bacterium]
MSETDQPAGALRLSARDLLCVRGDREVFRDVSFDLMSGDMLALVGPNGSGKSSLLRQVAGLLDVPAGEIVLEGAGAEARLSDHALYAGHLDAVKAPLTVLENLRFWADFYGAPRARISPALEGFELDHLATLPAGVLSAGQKRRLGLARLLLADRALWLLDEPTVSLDARTIGLLGQFMSAHLEKGGLILAATHVDLGISAARSLDLGGLRA